MTPPGHGGGGSVSTTSTVITTTSSTSLPTECAGATAIPASDGSPSGFARCPDGTVHRVEKAACNPSTGVVPCAGTESVTLCKQDAECGEGAHGRCGSVIVSTFGGPDTQCQCVYPCVDDSECGPGKACVCAGVVPSDNSFSFCAGAACGSGADCASGECGVSSYANGCNIDVELACRAASDACRTDADCASMPGTSCVLDGPDATWACLGSSCAIGRPLVVDGAPRVARAIERGDWAASGVSLALGGLDNETREAVATHWLEVAAFEHASVASFARVTLDLLALGAPAPLLAETQRAGLDEVEHARLAYAVASAYAARKLGPGALDLTSVPVRADAREIIRSLILEACVGETLGVAEALEIAGVVRDPALARVHARIAADEQRHAELAWRTLTWLLTGTSEAVRREAERWFDEAIAGAARDPAPRGLVLPEHGLLASYRLGNIRRRAIETVVAPCAAALFEHLRAGHLATPRAKAIEIEVEVDQDTAAA